MPGLMFPKARPKLLDQRDRKVVLAALDRVEIMKVKQRSGGRCEVLELLCGWTHQRRCPRRASQVHHLKAGIGRRNRGDSILSTHRLHTCDRCHLEITGRVLQPIGPGREDAATVVYERIRLISEKGKK